MLTKYTKELKKFVNSSSEKNLKKQLWLRLPYRVRLRIEHFCYVSNLIASHEKSIKRTVITAIKMPIYRKFGRLYPEMRKLNNPYHVFTNCPISDLGAKERIDMFLNRVSHNSNPFIDA